MLIPSLGMWHHQHGSHQHSSILGFWTTPVGPRASTQYSSTQVRLHPTAFPRHELLFRTHILCTVLSRDHPKVPRAKTIPLLTHGASIRRQWIYRHTHHGTVQTGPSALEP